MRKSHGPLSQETKDKISVAHKRSGHKPNPSVVDLGKARRVRWDGHTCDKVGILLGIYKGSARRRKIQFELSREEFEILINLPCYYCGDPPTERTLTSYKTRIVSTGIDRVDNSKGYTLDNCVPACKTCNVAKAALGQLEFINHCKKVAAKHGDTDGPGRR